MEQHNNNQSSGQVEDHGFEPISLPATPSPSATLSPASSFYVFTSGWASDTQDSPVGLKDDGHDLPDYGDFEIFGHDLPDYGDFEVLGPISISEEASGPENDSAAVAASAIEHEFEGDLVYVPQVESHEARKKKQGARIILQARRRKLQARRRAIQDVTVVAGGAHVETLAAVRSSHSSALGKNYSSPPAAAQARRRRKNAYPSPWALPSPKEEKEYDADCESDTDDDKESDVVPDDRPPFAQSALRVRNRPLGQIKIQKQVNERAQKRFRRIAMKGCERHEGALQRSLRRELTVLAEEERALHAEIEETKENDKVETEMRRRMESTSDKEEDSDEGRKGCGCFEEA
ncbi:hypothetical protein B0T09DRAFT_322990 [Sordaria sp. MPI-SDFR-AT-0083]|nr:hypothetical protein B0T09DRAFT_322990 [Sordaria sp. MPI-SDFR-AT-0083]